MSHVLADDSPLRTYIYSGVSLLASPVVVDDESLLFPISVVENDQVVGTLQSINMVSGQVNWTFSAGTFFRCTSAVANGTVYIGNDDGTLYALDLATGNQLWSLDLGGNVQTQPVVDPVTGLVFTGNNNGGFFAIDPVSHTTRWSSYYSGDDQNGYVGVSPAVLVGGVVFTFGSVDNPLAVGTTIYALDAATGALQWSADLSTGVSAPLTAGDGLLFVACHDGTLRAFDQSSGSQLWQLQTGNTLIGQPGYANGWVYVGSLDGTFYAHASHPQPLKLSEWAVPVNHDIPTGILVVGTNAYFGARDGSGNGYFYVLDLTAAAKGNPQALTEALSGQLIFTPQIGFGEIAFCAQGFFGGELIEIDLGVLGATAPGRPALPLARAAQQPAPAEIPTETSGMLERVAFTSQLIVDEYDVSGTSATPTTPAFQMMLNLLDDNQAPLTSCNVSIWASDAVTLTAAGQSYLIGTDSSNPTVIPADVTGQLATSSAGALGTPNLFLAPDFFLPGFYLTVFPDTGNFQRLSALQASDLDPSTALGYDGQPILLSNFQDLNSRTQIASAVSNSVGRQPQQVAARRLAQLVGDTPTRAYQPGDVPSFEVDFTSGVSFTPSSSSTIAKYFGGPAGPGQFWIQADFLGFGDFVNNIVNGLEKIGSIIWHFAEGVAGVIVNGVEQVYHFVVETVDQAIQVGAGIFKQVVADINKVIEWLSFLFEWKDIVNTHLLLKQQVLTTITNFENWVKSELSGATNDVDTFFNDREQDALTLFDGIITKLGGQTVDGVRQKGGNPNGAFSSQGQDVSAAAHWLPRKLSANAAQGSFGSGLAAKLADSSSPADTIGAFFTNVGQQIANDPAIQSLPNDVKTAVTSFSQLFTSSSGFVGQTLADVLAVVRDLVASLIHLGKVVADSFLKLLQTIVDNIVTFLTGKIDIPFVSAFYKLIADDDLSVLSLFCLIAAVPTTIVYKLITGSAPGSSTSPAMLLRGSTDWLGLANTFTLLLLLPLWIAADLGDFPPIMSGAIAGATAIQCALGLALICVDGPNAPDYILWSAQFLSVLLSVYGIWMGSAWAATGPTIYGAYGFGMMIFYVLYAALDSGKYFDPDSETFFANVLSALPYLGQPLSYIQVDDVGPAAVALVDAVGYGGSAALSTILYWT